ncbi:sulfite exporter TauE/SafE family protein [Craterilacuibacter sp. RT1T]|uniref:sulfite exporter TauE/SafE family protein n=1 Tax=Craterilacuibacter sp. RT1T TaxID=2942211 RepID=UPI0020C01BCF|nr:sulfite exporter TauE/SafE family protein [Craterilacuibacter sp. RT1T]MCL6264195.1 sulfite exporter TauE/SafE family protein [Craterilacuibacter sp. RT1T]
MLSLSLFAVLLGFGAIAGFLAGLLGVGGGLVIVPVVVGVLSAAHLGGAHVQHLAVGTSLAVMVFTSISSVRAHQQRGAVDWAIVRRMAPAMVLGTLAGSLIAGWIPGRELRWFFVIYAYVIGLQMYLGAKPPASRALPGVAGQWGAGGVIGVISSWVGIGGGSMSVPFMSWCNVPVHTAIGTSAALGWPIAVSGAIGYLASGWGQTGLPWGSLGFIYLPAMLTLMVMTVLLAPVGARAAHRLPVAKLKKAFALLMAVMATQMLWTLLH